MSDVIVVGAGVIGVSVAYSLAQHGMSVQLLESGRAGAGTSGTTFAIDITARKTPQRYFELALRSAELHGEWNERFGNPLWRFAAPSVEWGTNDHDREVMLGRRERLLKWGYESDLVDVADLEPLGRGLRLPRRGEGTAVVYPRASWYDPDAYIISLLLQARHAGVTLHEGVEITGLHYRGETLAGIRSGERVWEAEHVINCAGPAAGRLAALAGVELLLNLVPGVIGYLDPVPGLALKSIWSLWRINFRPTRSGGLCLHSYPLDAQLPDGSDATTPVPEELVDQLRKLAEPLLPERAADVGFVANVGMRPVPVDGFPILGAVPGEPRLYNAVTHSGVHLAPAIAELVAADLTSERTPAEVEVYRADRAVDEHAEALDDSMREMTRTYETGAAEVVATSERGG